jgi:predicted GH43/DUF377 family glycosyl hydrolase
VGLTPGQLRETVGQQRFSPPRDPDWRLRLPVPFLLTPDPARVLVRPFRPAPEPRDLMPLDRTRANHIVERVLDMDEEATARELAEVLSAFASRHRHLLRRCEARADVMEKAFYTHRPFNVAQRRLVGAYFLEEYAFEAAALLNPSIVPHPDQSGAPPGGLRFIMSLRAIGEGHVSSLTFRSGSVSPDGAVRLDLAGRFAALPREMPHRGDAGDEAVDLVFDDDVELNERVILPVTPHQANGIEDARFVRLDGEGGEARYCATYTAYSGRAIRSELLETKDFVSFRLSPLRGAAARNKGMALFPRRIDGCHAMISRQDNESLHLIYSEDLLLWEDGRIILRPRFPWEFVQIGTCGTPIELDEGWLLLTHGVGPMRQYAIGAVLLEKGDPSRVIARSRTPLLRPEPDARDGYVPNVVYTCGALRCGGLLVIPFARCDRITTVVTLPIAELLAGLELQGAAGAA